MSEVDSGVKQLFVGYTGAPEGNQVDNEIFVVGAVSESEAEKLCKFEELELTDNWVDGPRVRQFDVLEEAVSFAVARSRDYNGKVVRTAKVVGFDDEDMLAICKMLEEEENLEVELE